MGERLQHRGIRNNVSQVRRRVGFLPPPKTTISLHLEQIFFEQSFVIFDGFLASAEFCAIMKSERIKLTMFILSIRFFFVAIWIIKCDFTKKISCKLIYGDIFIIWRYNNKMKDAMRSSILLYCIEYYTK